MENSKERFLIGIDDTHGNYKEHGAVVVRTAGLDEYIASRRRLIGDGIMEFHSTKSIENIGGCENVPYVLVCADNGTKSWFITEAGNLPTVINDKFSGCSVEYNTSNPLFGYKTWRVSGTVSDTETAITHVVEHMLSDDYNQAEHTRVVVVDKEGSTVSVLTLYLVKTTDCLKNRKNPQNP